MALKKLTKEQLIKILEEIYGRRKTFPDEHLEEILEKLHGELEEKNSVYIEGIGTFIKKKVKDTGDYRIHYKPLAKRQLDFQSMRGHSLFRRRSPSRRDTRKLFRVSGWVVFILILLIIVIAGRFLNLFETSEDRILIQDSLIQEKLEMDTARADSLQIPTGE